MVRECSEDMIRTTRQMKSFFCICNWYSIYIPNYARKLYSVFSTVVLMCLSCCLLLV